MSASCTLVAAFALSSSSALALSQRGHVFGETFGKTGAGQLSGVAVNEATHEVYVVNHSAGTVERFKLGTTGKYEAAGELAVPSPEYVAVDNSNAAEDPSKGDVYVSSTTGPATAPKGAVYKFSSAGTELAKITKMREPFETLTLGRILGLAVGDKKGALWVDEEREEEPIVGRLSPEAPKQGAAALISPRFEMSVQGAAAPGFAVSAEEEDLYYTQTAETREEAEEAGVALCVRTPCLTTKFKLSEEPPEEEGELPFAELTELAPAVLGQSTSALAVDLFGDVTPRDDVYLDNGSSVAVLDANGSLVQRFGAPELGLETGLQEGRGVAIDSSTGNVFVVDAAAGQVDLFAPAPAGPPSVDSIAAARVKSQSVELNAELDPDGAETEYTFQYSTSAPVSCAPVSTVPCEAPAGRVAASFGDQPVGVEVAGLQSNTVYHFRVIATNTHGRVVSEERAFTTRGQSSGKLVLPDAREWELVSPSDKKGANIEPIESAGAAIQAAANGDAITYIADAPVQSQVEGNRNFEPTQVLSTRGSSWSSQDINTRDETSQGPVSGGKPPEYTLFSTNLSLAVVFPFAGQRGTLAEPALSPPLPHETKQEATAYIRANGPNPPLQPEATSARIFNAALGNGAAMGDQGFGFLALVNEVNDTTGVPFGTHFKVEDATPDLSHVVLQSLRGVPLTPQPASKSLNLYEWSAESSGDLPAGHLKLISQLPGGTPASHPVLGSVEQQNDRHVISNDGSRVFWGNEETALYMRDTQKEQTVELSAVQQGAGEGVPKPLFQLASGNGSRVLFEDSQHLLEEAGAVGNDIYQCEIIEVPNAEGHMDDKCALADRTPAFKGSSARVLGLVLGATEGDLSRTYFVANGVLSENANAQGEEAQEGDCTTENTLPPAGATCNLYLNEPDPENPGHYKTIFIARLSNGDVPDFNEAEQRLNLLTARVSPNGERLAFMSDQPLTHYNTADARSGKPDEEVYVYNAASNQLVCASCNPSGARPTGVLDTREAGEGIGLVVDRVGIWSTSREGAVDNWLAGSVPGWTPSSDDGALYQSRYLSNEGRLFFNSVDALVPQDTNGKEDVYEYEPPGLGSCTTSSVDFSASQAGCISLVSSGTSSRESAFLDASETGGDVFFLTSEGISPQDLDTSFDVYDAHECTGASPCLPPPPSSSSECESEESCRGGFSPSPAFEAPSSTTFSGAGNLVPVTGSLPFKKTVKPKTRAQLLASALKACKKKKGKAKRLSCERQARKKYGPKTKKRAKSSTHKRSAKRSSK